jgi:hypothetical protein
MKSDRASVKSEVMLSAKPADLQRLGVVVMVRLRVDGAAGFARPTEDFSPLKVGVSISPGIHLPSLGWIKVVGLSPSPHVSGVAMVTGPSALPERSPARAVGHGNYVNVERGGGQ